MSNTPTESMTVTVALDADADEAVLKIVAKYDNTVILSFRILPNNADEWTKAAEAASQCKSFAIESDASRIDVLGSVTRFADTGIYDHHASMYVALPSRLLVPVFTRAAELMRGHEIKSAVARTVAYYQSRPVILQGTTYITYPALCQLICTKLADEPALSLVMQVIAACEVDPERVLVSVRSMIPAKDTDIVVSYLRGMIMAAKAGCASVL